ncbi:MAG: hypothetical protein GY719_35780 [bacterium]|nr:hypothetical protein [bacterium]
MHRTTLMLPPELKLQAQQKAREQGISLGEYIRRAIESELSGSGALRRAADPLFADTAVFTGDAPTDSAAEHDRYLYGDRA